MARTAIPSVYPKEGVYEATMHVRLSCMDEDAHIYYTMDGSEPTEKSREFIFENGVIPLNAVHGKDTPFVIRAMAVAEGKEPSRIATYNYRIIAKPVGEYYVEVLRERTADTAGVIRIMDQDTDKMYLVVGTKQAILIDGGIEDKGDLLGLCEDLTGGDLPVSMFIAHGHLDHYGQAGNFIRAGKKVYMAHVDFGTITKLHMPCPYDDINAYIDVHEGDVYDMGNTTLRAYAVPGHTPGSMVLVDEKTGDVFASDALGSTRRQVPDSLFMQLGDGECALDSYLHALEHFRDVTRGKIVRVFTGHSEEPLPADECLNVLIEAVCDALERGEDALIPSVRSREESLGSGCIVSRGSYRMDPVWTMINVKYMHAEDAAKNPPKYAKGYEMPDFGKKFS